MAPTAFWQRMMRPPRSTMMRPGGSRVHLLILGRVGGHGAALLGREQLVELLEDQERPVQLQQREGQCEEGADARPDDVIRVCGGAFLA
eukprot:3753832-Prymnesium_polylepis.1